MSSDDIPKLCECGCEKPVRRRFVRGHNMLSKTRIITNDDYVLENRGYSSSCWISRWKPSDPRGYTRVRSANRRIGIHVLMWIQVNGPVPEGLFIDHLCREPSCINPAHLEPVSHTENVRRGKVPKLTPEKVRTIRFLRGLGYRQEEIARRVQSTRGTVSNVLRGVHWNDIH